MKNEFVIVTRHEGAIEWLRRMGIEGNVISHATESDVSGKVVIGVVPLSLAVHAVEVWAIDMPGLRIDQRGKDLSPEEMNEAGACLSKYKVSRA